MHYPLLPQSTRDEMANNLTNSSDSVKSELEEVKQNFTERRDKAQKYDLIFRGDIADEIRLTYDQKVMIMSIN